MIPFYVKDATQATVTTGLSAVTLAEMRQILISVPLSSIYYHFWGKRLNPFNSSGEYLNDFAGWAHRGLHDDVLAERLAIIDPCDYKDLNDLRIAVIEIIEARMDEIEYSIWSKKETKFYFLSALTIVFDTQSVVAHPSEWKEKIGSLSHGSIYYHFIDARRRTPENMDDFSTWIKECCDHEYEELLSRIKLIDPYFNTLGEIKLKLVHVFNELFA